MFHPQLSFSATCVALTAIVACSSEVPPGPPPLDPLQGASVSFASPSDGAVVTSPVTLVFEVQGAQVQPAGTVEAGTGHHHILIGHGAWPLGEIIPADETHIHYGDGRTQTELELVPGEYDLTMQFADFMHRSFGEDLAATIHVTVKEN